MCCQVVIEDSDSDIEEIPAVNKSVEKKKQTEAKREEAKPVKSVSATKEVT